MCKISPGLLQGSFLSLAIGWGSFELLAMCTVLHTNFLVHEPFLATKIAPA